MLVNGKSKSSASSVVVPTTAVGLTLSSLSGPSSNEEINNDSKIREDFSVGDFPSYLDSPSRQIPAQPQPGQLFGPFIEPLQWLKVRNALNIPGLFTTEQLLGEFSYLEPDMLRLFMAVQMADCPENQNTEIILKNNKFYFRVLCVESMSENGITSNNLKKSSKDLNGPSNSNCLADANDDNSQLETDVAEDLCKYDHMKPKSKMISKSQTNGDGFLNNTTNNSNDVPSPASINSVTSLALYAWFNEELSQKLPSPSVNCLNGVRRYFCALCNQVFANPNPVVLHILFSCPCREQLLPNGVTPKPTTSATLLSSSSISSSASSSSPISTLSSSSTPSLTFPYLNHLPTSVSSSLLSTSSTITTASSPNTLPVSTFSVSSSGLNSISPSVAQSNCSVTLGPTVSSSCSTVQPNSISSGSSSSAFTSPLPRPQVRTEDLKLPINYSLSNTTQRNSLKTNNKKRAFDIDSLVNGGQSELTHNSTTIPATRTPTPKRPASRSTKNNNKDESTSARCSAFKPKQTDSSASLFNSSAAAATNSASLNPLLSSLSHLPPYSAIDPASFAAAAAAAAASKDAKTMAANPFLNSAALSALGGSQYDFAALYAHQQRQLLQCLMPGLSLPPSHPPSSISNAVSTSVTSAGQNSQAAAAAAAAAYSPFFQSHSLAAGLAGLPGVNANVNPALSSLHGLAGLSGLHSLTNHAALGNLSTLNSLTGLNNGLNNAFYAFNNLLPNNVMSGLAALGQQSPLSANSLFGTVSSTSSTPSTSVVTINSNPAPPPEKPPPKKKKTKEPKDHNNNSNNSTANSNNTNSQTNKNSVLTAALTSGLGASAFGGDLSSCGPSVVSTANLHSPDAKSMLSPQMMNYLPPSLAALSYPQTNLCSLCKQEFRMTSDLVYHIRSYHKEFADFGATDNSTSKKKRDENKLRCNICGEGFRERHHLTRHMTSHN